MSSQALATGIAWTIAITIGLVLLYTGLWAVALFVWICYERWVGSEWKNVPNPDPTKKSRWATLAEIAALSLMIIAISHCYG